MVQIHIEGQATKCKSRGRQNHGERYIYLRACLISGRLFRGQQKFLLTFEIFFHPTHVFPHHHPLLCVSHCMPLCVHAKPCSTPLVLRHSNTCYHTNPRTEEIAGHFCVFTTLSHSQCTTLAVHRPLYISTQCCCNSDRRHANTQVSRVLIKPCNRQKPTENLL